MAVWVRFFLGVFLSLGLLGSAVAATESAPVEPFIVVKADGKTMDEVLRDLKRAIAEHNYVFIRQQTIDMGLVPEADENKNIMVVYFCNFSMLAEALKQEKRVGVYLPCRVTLIRDGDGVRMLVMNPKFVSGALHEERLGAMCEQLTADYRDILAEATL
jgi:cytochrome c oxidase cbb3-type subunit III